MKFTALIPFSLFYNLCFAKTCYEGICLPKNYSQATRPFLKLRNNVTIDFLHIKTLNIDDFKCSFEIYLYVNLKWKDSRIEIDSDISNSIALNSELTSLLWKPDLFTYNQKTFKGFILLNNRPLESIWIDNNKNLGLKTHTG